MKAEINFYNEKVEITLPSTFTALKSIIAAKYMMEESDVNEFIYNVNVPNITNIQSQYEQLLKSKISGKIEITVQVCETSKLYQDELNKIINEEKKNEQMKEQSQVNQSQSKIAVHSSYICDGCGMNPIKGIRYKCTVCKDFDYCEGCEVTLSSKHGHPFLKIRKPEFAPVKVECKLTK